MRRLPRVEGRKPMALCS
uniref:Uncharacterized protein n=1 Tax=Anguilla anguilla TaxID=7936 RepID=A0A0E9UAG5_ANGAN